ncbi:MAG: PqqD family protein [Thermoanaerobaculia bacterium]
MSNPNLNPNRRPIPPIPPDARFRAREGVLARELDGEAVLLDVASGRYFGLNDSGRRIWALLSGDLTLETLAGTLAAEFARPPENLLEDVVELLGELEREGLVDRVG